MPDTNTPETPAELASQIKRMIEECQDAWHDYKEALRIDVAGCITAAVNAHNRSETALHIAIDRLESLATLAASSTAPADAWIRCRVCGTPDTLERARHEDHGGPAWPAPAAAERKPPRDPSRTRIDAQDVAELTARIKADPEVGARLMREAGIWDENNQLTPQFGGAQKG